MAENSICSNCGNTLKSRKLVCKHCHQARWKMIIPYYIWGVVFLAATWWLAKNKLPDAFNATDFFSLILILSAAIFTILGVVMLLIALIATIKGLFVKEVTEEQRLQNAAALLTPNFMTPIESATNQPGSPQAVISTPEVSPTELPDALEYERPAEQIIFCQKCKHKNTCEATRCSQCGTTLLPGEGAAERIGAFIATILLALLSFGGAYLFFRFNPEWGLKAMLFLVGLIVFGVMAFVYGIFLSLRKIPLHERYEKRAKRHISLNAWQAIADFGSAINTAPPDKALDYLLERAKLYQGLGKTAEARSEWQRALENINLRLAVPKASIDLLKQRAELYRELGMQDEYAMQMLLYTIEKEKTFKTQRSDIAMGWEEGLKKGTEDFHRQELDKLRAEILANPRYKIVGQCKNCHALVELNARLECPTNPKHKKLSDIHPIIHQDV